VTVLLALAALTGWWRWAARSSAELTDDLTLIARGERIYAAQCASCHGRALEGQPDWQSPLPNGRMPAPPQDDTGHTWHHPNRVVFEITKFGLVPPNAPANYASDMPAFGGKLTDEDIWAVLSFIASSWSEQAKAWQRNVDAQSRR
jgi:mono/diheme cytochrome c family protein